MDSTLSQLLSEIFNKHLEIARLKERITELEAALNRAKEGTHGHTD